MFDLFAPKKKNLGYFQKNRISRVCQPPPPHIIISQLQKKKTTSSTSKLKGGSEKFRFFALMPYYQKKKKKTQRKNHQRGGTKDGRGGRSNNFKQKDLPLSVFHPPTPSPILRKASHSDPSIIVVLLLSPPPLSVSSSIR